MSKCSIKLNKVAEFAMKFRYKFLLKGSKETALGKVLRGLFPSAFVYVLLLSNIIAEFKPDVYMHLVFFVTIVFLSVYSFFNEVLYDSHEDMQNTVLENLYLMLFGIFWSPKRPI